MSNEQLIAMLVVLCIAVLAGISIGWAMWGREATKIKRYKHSHDGMLNALFIISDPEMRNPDSMRTIAEMALRHEVP